MVHSVSIKKVDTNAFARMEWKAIHTKKDAFLIKPVNQVNVAVITIVLIHWLVYKAHVLAHARAYCVVKMRTVSQKIMQLGVDAVLVLRKMKVANVFHVSCFYLPSTFCMLLENKRFCGQLMT